MEVLCEVHIQNIEDNTETLSHQAFMTFVALNKFGVKVEVPQIETQNEVEQKLYDGALRRRELRLVLAGKLDPKEAKNLKKIFLT